MQYGAIDDVFYFHFALNDTSGSGADGTTPLFDVRLCGAADNAAPVQSGTPTLLSHADYGAGCYEIAITASTGNGYAANNKYAVFCAATVSTQNPSGFVGAFATNPIPADLRSILGTVLTETAGLIAAGFKKFFNIASPTSTMNQITLVDTTTTNTDMRGTDNAATASGLATAQADLDLLTGADGVTLATSQPNYAPGTAAELAKVPKSDSNVTWNATAAAQIQSEVNDGLVAYDPPTRAEATSDKDEIVADIATAQTEINKIPRAGETHTWTNTGTLDAATVEITTP